MRTRIRHGLVAALAVSALSLTAACGGGDAKDGTKKAADKPAAEATSAAPAAAKPLTAEQMKAATLTLKDLPAGWKNGSADPDQIQPKADKAECQPLAGFMADTIAGATMGPSGSFERTSDTTGIDSQVFTFPAAGATDFFKALSTSLDTCKGFAAELQGMKMTVTAEKLTGPKAGEESQAFRLKMKVADIAMTVETNLLVVRQGTGLVRVSHVPPNASGHKDFDTLAKLAADKFVKGAQS
ncbi:hypothetical protein GPZ77_11145 [Streptomyces sp. QHH-9511]|uniref:hypothetical protein n=1 Tax=Streptomyces sp. QHH-9511 TaxID=2684468 RepID=UPI001318E6EE|nr:hypothetical protein [Streptomyces sp. QHH-9511]QGZ48862.1 hypothetical protein GPZ77_11145 [Streptomyces sp. QHH-9511]